MSLFDESEHVIFPWECELQTIRDISYFAEAPDAILTHLSRGLALVLGSQVLCLSGDAGLFRMAMCALLAGV